MPKFMLLSFARHSDHMMILGLDNREIMLVQRPRTPKNVGALRLGGRRPQSDAFLGLFVVCIGVHARIMLSSQVTTVHVFPDACCVATPFRENEPASVPQAREENVGHREARTVGQLFTNT